MANGKMKPAKVIEKTESLAGQRGTWDSFFQELADYMYPRKNTVQNKRSPGDDRQVQIVDSTGQQSLEMLASALQSFLVNPTIPFFGLTTGIRQIDDRDDVRQYFEYCDTQMFHTLANSNFQTEMNEYFLDLCGFGTACLDVQEDDRSIVRFKTHFIAEYFIEENHHGQIDAIYRKWEWNASNIVREYGIEKLPQKIKKAYEDGDDQKFKVIHAVYPSMMMNAEPSGMPFISQHILADEEIELRVGGFNEFPFIVSRFSKASGEIMGRSPAMVALPDVKMLNVMDETVLKGAQMAVAPPIQVPDDGFILPIKVRPFGINFKRAGSVDDIKPIFNDTRIDFGYEVLRDRRERVRAAFHIDQLQLIEKDRQTATEVMRRSEDGMRFWGPILARQHHEFLRPFVDRLFGIMSRRQMFPDPPAILRNRTVDVQFNSMVARAQRAVEGQNILRTIEAAAPFIQLDPTSADNFSGDAAIRALARIFNFPQSAIRPEIEVRRIREQRARAQQEMMQQQQQQANAEVVSKVSPLLQTGS